MICCTGRSGTGYLACFYYPCGPSGLPVQVSPHLVEGCVNMQCVRYVLISPSANDPYTGYSGTTTTVLMQLSQSCTRYALILHPFPPRTGWFGRVPYPSRTIPVRISVFHRLPVHRLPIPSPSLPFPPIPSHSLPFPLIPSHSLPFLPLPTPPRPLEFSISLRRSKIMNIFFSVGE
jgi:hypothetical protein